ncbi:hypothetical protein [Prosthecobacter sp.]|jgi:hypothetical protein|uniref:hypothetical protein n=1 Tax=Prosthecobacter sp. TaxID=1965333 RepID=UPI00378481FB
MNENSPQPAPEKGPWWFVWILSTVIFPGATFGMLASNTRYLEVIVGVVGFVTFVMHIVSSVKLGKGGSGWLTAGLIFGGWALMFVSLFVGCVVLVSQT